MYSSSGALAAASLLWPLFLTPTALALPQAPQAGVQLSGQAIIHNNCPYDVYVYSVDDFQDPKNEDGILIPANNARPYSEPLRVPRPGCNCGPSLKISRRKSKERPITQFEYSVWEEKGSLHYDTSFVDCSTADPGHAAVDGYAYYTGEQCPGWEGGVDIYGEHATCERMECGAGRFCPHDSYFMDVPGFEQPVRQCAEGVMSTNLHFVMCSGATENLHKGAEDGSGGQGPATTTTAAPAPTQESGDPNQYGDGPRGRPQGWPKGFRGGKV